MLSFNKGEPVARIIGGEHDGKIIHVYDEVIHGKVEKKGEKVEKKGRRTKKNDSDSEVSDEESYSGSGSEDEYSDYSEDDSNSDEEGVKKKTYKKYGIKVTDPYDYLRDEEISKYKKKMNTMEKLKLQKALLKKQKPVEPELAKAYTESRQVLKQRAVREFNLQDGTLQPLPSKTLRDSLWIAGRSGSGKSTYAANFIKEWQKMHPKRTFRLFSKVEKDHILDKLGPHRIKLNKELVEDPIQVKELKNKHGGDLVVFDDVNTIEDKKISDAVLKLKNSILEEGRSHTKDPKDHVCIINTGHQPTDYGKTRDVLNESSAITIFPGNAGQKSINYLLKEYIGLKKEQITKVKNLKSRWVTFTANRPACVIHEHGVFMIDT